MGVSSTHHYSEGRRSPEKKDKEMLTSQKALLPVKNKVNGYYQNQGYLCETMCSEIHAQDVVGKVSR